MKAVLDLTFPKKVWLIRDPEDTKTFSGDDGEAVYLFTTEAKLRAFADTIDLGEYVPTEFTWNGFIEKFGSGFKRAYLDINPKTRWREVLPIVKIEEQ